MSKRKKREKRSVPLNELRQGPIRHKQGLSPLLTELARNLFQRAGHYVYPSFEQWELGFMRDMHPWREILIWEAICRAHEAYVAKHPEAANHATIIPALAAISAGATLEKEPEKSQEMQTLLKEAWGKRWTPWLDLPLEFPEDSALVLQFEDIVDGHDGQIDPKLNRAIDPRCALAGAEVILGTDQHEPDQHFLIYGRDILEQSPEGEVPEGTRVLIISLDAQNTTTNELDKILAVVHVVKRRDDCR
ncbi:MAG: hypothetical protein ABSG53_28570 [Thermoguttaceae bacterium]